MIISTDHKIAYLSNSKCASTTIRKHFLQVQNEELVKEVQSYALNNPHMPYHKISNYLLEQHDIDISNFFLFSTIRNPWERIVSLYNYCKPDKNGVPFWSAKFGVPREEGTSCTFEEFIFSNLNTNYNKTAGSFRHACKNVQDMFGDNYKKFKLYRCEELDINEIMDDMDNPEVDSKVGRKTLEIVDSNDWTLTKEKRDSEENYREYYNDELRNIIANHYELDIQIGAYEF